MEQKRWFVKMVTGVFVILMGLMLVSVMVANMFSAETALYIVLVLIAASFVGVILYYMGERRELNREFMQNTSVDDLTGLPTKEKHKMEATQILRENKGKYAYVSLDIADFKLFNETYGYNYGNMALKHITSVFTKGLKRDELISRTTGDHFSMLFRCKKKHELEARLQRMLTRAAQFPIDGKGGSHTAVFRCGIYFIQGDEDINVIRSRADMARRSLGKCFKTGIGFYSEEDLAAELEKKELLDDIQRAVEEHELMVYFQPKFDIVTEQVVGAEALIRWNHPEKGVLPPGRFIPACEENGYVCTLDFYVLDRVCSTMKQWADEGKELVKVSLNFSRLHLANKDFLNELTSIVKSYGLNPGSLEIELTETAAYDEMDHLLDVMRSIKRAGFGLSMDDFGSGYSSLNLLREMPVDVLKLDKGFLDECPGADTTRERRIISHVISMAKDLEISVLAEGVETMQQKEFLKESRCDMVQGYYFAKPMPTENFANYLKMAIA